MEDAFDPKDEDTETLETYLDFHLKRTQMIKEELDRRKSGPE